MRLNESLGGRRLEGVLEFYHPPTSALDFCQTSDRYFDFKFCLVLFLCLLQLEFLKKIPKILLVARERKFIWR